MSIGKDGIHQSIVKQIADELNITEEEVNIQLNRFFSPRRQLGAALRNFIRVNMQTSGIFKPTIIGYKKKVSLKRRINQASYKRYEAKHPERAERWHKYLADFKKKKK